ncbi:MAG: hypothetical protein J6K95_05455 [Rikenellaceae bacterium]|nr:hypothetical protein [Rikenellaceae bacterium]
MKKFYFVSFIVTVLLSVAAYFVSRASSQSHLVHQNVLALQEYKSDTNLCGIDDICMSVCEYCGTRHVAYDLDGEVIEGAAWLLIGRCPVCGEWSGDDL